MAFATFGPVHHAHDNRKAAGASFTAGQPLAAEAFGTHYMNITSPADVLLGHVGQLLAEDDLEAHQPVIVCHCVTCGVVFVSRSVMCGVWVEAAAVGVVACQSQVGISGGHHGKCCTPWQAVAQPGLC